MKNLGKILGTAIPFAVGTLLPMQGLEAQTSTDNLLSDTIETEQVEENTLNYSVGADLENKSRFWGLPFVDSPHFKSNMGINFGNTYLSFVGHVRKGEFFDLDTDITYIHSLSDKISASVGVMRFDFNDPEKGWIVGYIPHTSISANVSGNPSIGYNRLIGFGGGDYIEGSISEGLPVGGRNLNIEARVGYNMNAMIDGQRFTHIQGNISLPLEIKGISVNPYVNIFGSLSDDVQNGTTFGVSVNTEF